MSEYVEKSNLQGMHLKSQIMSMFMGDSVLNDTVQANRRQLSVVCSLRSHTKQITRIRSNITCRTSEAETYSQTFVKSL